MLTLNKKIDLVFIIFLLLAGLKLTFGIHGLIDIALWDETSSLSGGINLIIDGYPGSYRSSIYQLWYYFLYLISPDPINLFYLNLTLQIIILPIVFYFFLRLCKISEFYSFIFSFICLLSFCNTLTMPRGSIFAAIVMLVFLILAISLNNHYASVLVFATGCLVTSFARPEYFTSFILASLYIFVIAVSDYKNIWNNKTILYGLLIFLISSSLIISIFGNPLSGGKKYLFFAFAQSFAHNWVSWNNIDINPYFNYEMIIEEVYGKVNNLFAAFAANPFIFLKHVLTNFIKYVISLFIVLFLHINIILPSSSVLFNIIEALFGFIALLVLLYLYREKLFINIKNIIHDYKTIILYFIILFIPTFITAFIVTTRKDYLIMQYLIILSSCVIIVHGSLPNIELKDLKKVVSLGIIFLMITPYISGNWYFTKSPLRAFISGNWQDSMGNRVLININTINFIRSLKIHNKQVNLLEAEGGYNIYLGKNFRWVPHYNKESKFSDFLLTNSINMVVATEELNKDIRYQNDQQWIEFMANYKNYGFKKMDIPNTNHILYISGRLLD